MKITAGMPAESTDGPCGEIADIVVDPITWCITHLVVQPHHRHDRARLVPVSAAESSDGQHVVLSWTTSQVEHAAVVEATDFVSCESWPHIKGGWDVGVNRVLTWPFFTYAGLGMAGLGYPYGYGRGYGRGGPAQVTMTYDRVPEGTVEVRRSSRVLSSDGHVVGHVDGFLVDPTARITHLVLDPGHLWGHRDVTIPIIDLDRAESDTVYLRVAREAIGEYPMIPLDPHGAQGLPALSPSRSGV